MGELSRTDVHRIGAVEDCLLCYSLSGDSLAAAVEALAVVLETERAIVYSLEVRPLAPGAKSDELAVGIAHVSATSSHAFRETFDRWLAGRGVVFSTYSPLHPEPDQRNRVLSATELRATPTRAERELFAALGFGGRQTLRTLVCEGASLLAWVGLVQPDAPTARQRRVLRKLLPAFRQRLRFERWVRDSALASNALPLALESIGAPAWVLGCDGRVLHTNEAGRSRLRRRSAAATRSELRACVAGASTRMRAVRIANVDVAHGYLVVDPDAAARGPAVDERARRMGLTPAQTRVLGLVARGLSNATIAAELAVAERTVEAHVTAILDKAQVPSRAALIAALLAI